MNIFSRLAESFGLRTLALGLITGLSLAAAAADYPERPVQTVVNVAAGGSTDTAARLIAQKLSERLGQPFMVETKTGAATRLGTDFVMKAKPDGYTLGYFFGITGVFQLMFENFAPLQPGKDFEPITLVTRAPSFLAVNAALPIKNVSDFIAYARANNDKISFGHSGNASTPNIAAMVLLKSIGVKGLGIPYKGNVPTAVALAAGEINFSVVDYTAARPMVERGLVRLIAVTEPKRATFQPDVPTAGEAGLTHAADGITPWTLLAAPPGTPSAVIATLNKHMVEILKMPDVQERLRTVGVEVEGTTPAQAATSYVAERDKLVKIVRDLGVSLKN
ncbi:MAG: tripartite tricarboxylate transporter substrate binding protein [Polaromonas sp.]